MYKIQLTSKVTCVDIEQELALTRGDVTEITQHADGRVDVCFGIEPTADQKAALQSMLNKRIAEEPE